MASTCTWTAGVVYHSFDRKDHVAELKVDPSLPLLWALDFNVDPMSSVVAQSPSRQNMGARRDCAAARDDRGGVRAVS